MNDVLSVLRLISDNNSMILTIGVIIYGIVIYYKIDKRVAKIEILLTLVLKALKLDKTIDFK